MRHFGKHNNGGPAGTGEDVIILGQSTEDKGVLVAVLAGLTVDDAAQLRSIAGSHDGQNRDFLLSILNGHHHPSGEPWDVYIVKAFTSGSRAFQRVMLRNLTFADAGQRAYYHGDDTSTIEPEQHAIRAHQNATIRAVKTGAPLPSSMPPPVAAAPVPAAPDPALAAIAEALTNLSAGQQAMAEALGKLKPAKAPARRKAGGRKPGPKPKTDKAEPEILNEVAAETTEAPATEAHSD